MARYTVRCRTTDEEKEIGQKRIKGVEEPNVVLLSLASVYISDEGIKRSARVIKFLTCFAL